MRKHELEIMKKLYYDFVGYMKGNDPSNIDLYLSKYSKKSCPFSKMGVFVQDRYKSVTKSFKDAFNAALSNKISIENYTQIKSELVNSKTIKVCPAVNTLLENCFLYKAPCDIKVVINGKHFDLLLSDERMLDFGGHSTEQHSDKYGDNVFGDQLNIKFKPPFKLKCNSKLMWIQPVFHGNQPWTVVPGLIDENYMSSGQSAYLNLLFPLSNETKVYNIKAGTVLAYIWSPDKLTLQESKYNIEYFRRKFFGI
jgi:hypothetical protein